MLTRRVSQFVVDGAWTTDHTAPQETDAENNLNNVLTPERIAKPPAAAAIMSGVTPQSTTSKLATAVPLESKEVKDPTGMPGHFPETPRQEAAEFSVNPIPATAGAGNPISLAAGDSVPPPSESTSKAISSNAHDDPSLAARDADATGQTFAVAPLPATAGLGNPVQLKPGEKVPEPSSFTTNTVASTVTTDQESYEKGGSSVPMGGDAAEDKHAGLAISSAAPHGRHHRARGGAERIACEHQAQRSDQQQKGQAAQRLLQRCLDC